MHHSEFPTSKPGWQAPERISGLSGKWLGILSRLHCCTAISPDPDYRANWQRWWIGWKLLAGSWKGLFSDSILTIGSVMWDSSYPKRGYTSRLARSMSGVYGLDDNGSHNLLTALCLKCRRGYQNSYQDHDLIAWQKTSWPVEVA